MTSRLCSENDPEIAKWAAAQLANMQLRVENDTRIERQVTFKQRVKTTSRELQAFRSNVRISLDHRLRFPSP